MKVSRPTEQADRSYADGHELKIIHISEPTRQAENSDAVFCLKKKNRNEKKKQKSRDDIKEAK